MSVTDRGRIGETRVEPGQLFAPEDRASGPPADALDVQFRAPLSFSLFADDLFRADREEDGRACFAVYEQVMDATAVEMQVLGGYVVNEHGASLPARLELTAYGESTVPGFDTLRIHHHLYIGRTAVSLRDGRRLPVDGQRLHRAADSASSAASQTVRELTEQRFGCRWGPPPGGYASEILDPPIFKRTGSQQQDAATWAAALGVCPSPWGPRTTWEQPSREALEMMAADARLIARDGAPSSRE